MQQIVYVVTCADMGWDCVVGVYDNAEEAQKEADLYEEMGFVHKKVVNSIFVE